MDKKFEEKYEHKADDDVQPVLELVDRLVMQKGIDVEKNWHQLYAPPQAKKSTTDMDTQYCSHTIASVTRSFSLLVLSDKCIKV